MCKLFSVNFLSSIIFRVSTVKFCMWGFFFLHVCDWGMVWELMGNRKSRLGNRGRVEEGYDEAAVTMLQFDRLRRLSINNMLPNTNNLMIYSWSWNYTTFLTVFAELSFSRYGATSAFICSLLSTRWTILSTWISFLLALFWSPPPFGLFSC